MQLLNAPYLVLQILPNCILLQTILPHYIVQLYNQMINTTATEQGHWLSRRKKREKMSQISRQQRRQFLDEKLSCRGSSIHQSHLTVGFIFFQFLLNPLLTHRRGNEMERSIENIIQRLKNMVSLIPDYVPTKCCYAVFKVKVDMAWTLKWATTHYHGSRGCKTMTC